MTPPWAVLLAAAAAGHMLRDLFDKHENTMPSTPLSEMHGEAAEFARRHIAAGGLAYRMTPGAGYERTLTSRTACTSLLKLDGSGQPCALLMECAPGEDIDDAAEFICQQIAFAKHPSDEMADLGIAPSAGTLNAIMFFDGLDTIDYLFLRNEVLNALPNTTFMGHVSEYPQDFWIER